MFKLAGWWLQLHRVYKRQRETQESVIKWDAQTARFQFNEWGNLGNVDIWLHPWKTIIMWFEFLSSAIAWNFTASAI